MVIDLFAQITAAGLPEPVCEYRFCATRRFRFDWAFPEAKLAVEQEGGIWRRGRGAHSSPKGILRDIEKGNLAVVLGWRVLRVTPDMVASGEALKLIEQALGGKP